MGSVTSSSYQISGCQGRAADDGVYAKTLRHPAFPPLQQGALRNAPVPNTKGSRFRHPNELKATAIASILSSPSRHYGIRPMMANAKEIAIIGWLASSTG